jgi:hypothetical protein
LAKHFACHHSPLQRLPDPRIPPNCL